MKYIYPFYSEFNFLPYYNYFCYKNPGTVVFSPKKVSCMFTYAKEVIELDESFFDKTTTENTVRGGIFSLDIYENELNCIIKKYNLKKEDFHEFKNELRILINSPAQIYPLLFQAQSEMVQDKVFKFITTEEKTEEKYVTIIGRNLNKTNGTNHYNATMEKLIEFLVKNKVKVKNLTMHKPNLSFDNFYYEEIECVNDYKKQTEIMNLAQVNFLYGIAGAPNVHLMCGGNFVVLFAGNDLTFIGNPEYCGSGINMLDSRKIHQQYLTEISICKQPIHGGETYDYIQIKDVLEKYGL